MKVFGELRYRPAGVDRGYTDRILRIDLSNHTITIEDVPEEMRDSILISLFNQLLVTVIDVIVVTHLLILESYE